ncbi:hypothetical protein LXL04_012412 [Taraxacum kok-saghyz]
MNVDEGRANRFGTTIHITALDGIVNVNSLFTLAVFIGLAWQPTDPNNSLVDDPKCVAGPKIAEDLICFHVYSFSSFLFSSLVALSLKQAIRIAKTSCETRRLMIFTFDMCHINKNALRVGYLISAMGSVCGCGFLMMALVNVAQIKLGTLGCGSSHTYGAKMEASMKNICLLGFLVALAITSLGEVNGAGECGKANPDMEAFKLAPCASAAQDENASVSGSCCAQVKKLGQNPKCLCAVMLSNTAKSSGIKPEIAMTIPKRCNIVDRPVGYHCGGSFNFILLVYTFTNYSLG